MISLHTPLSSKKLEDLRAGDEVLLSGTIYTGRDAAHKRLAGLVHEHKSLPFDLHNQVMYYVGPTPNKPDAIFGSGGPTTSGRMDLYTPTLLSQGLKVMIGKGYRNTSVKEAMCQHKAVYLGAIGGIGALLSDCVKSCEIIAFADLGTEAVRKLEVEDMPLLVLIDSLGHDLYDIGPQKYLQSK